MGRSGIDAAAIGIGSIALFLLVVAHMAGLIRQVEQQAAQLERLAQHDPLAVALLDPDHFVRADKALYQAKEAGRDQVRATAP